MRHCPRFQLMKWRSVRQRMARHLNGLPHSIPVFPTNSPLEKPDRNTKDDETVFSQGDAADAVFYIQSGKVKLTAVSTQGKEAVVAILPEGSFFGEGCLAGQPLRMATATRCNEPPSFE